MFRIKALFLSVILICTYASVSSAAETNPVEVKKDDKCPVCGMFVAKYRHWIAQIVYKDGSYAVFDGPKDMFKYYLDPGKYHAAKKTADISGVFVTEYYSTKLMDARKMFYVKGSNIFGPMGDELIPLASEADALEFMRDHKGSGILKFTEVTNEHLK